MYFYNRRVFLGSVGLAFATTRGLFAQALAETPRLTEGPYYPDVLPLDTDNDLVILNDRLTPAVGEITRLTGRVLTRNGTPIKDAVIEIWQADNNGIYINSRSPHKERQDKNFQGYGRFETSSSGQYSFRTIKPVPYENRCPHIHVRVKKGDSELVTTQIFVRGHSMNNQDGVLSELRDPLDRELVLASFKPLPNSPAAELAAHFDIVVGRTPSEQSFRKSKSPRTGDRA